MEFQHDNSAPVKNGSATATTNKAAQNGAAKDHGTQPKKDSTTAPVQADKPKATNGTDKPVPQAAEQTSAVSVPQPVKPIAPVLNLEGTLKVVQELHRRSIHRINLISRIKQLEAFEITLTQEHDELEENPYQGCKLIIEDDKKRQFVTTTPGLIRLVAQFIFNACHEKRVEIEAEIVFPRL